MGVVIWNHHTGYAEAVEKVKKQTLEDDLQLIDNLYGRDNLAYGMSATGVKEEALRQLEIEYRSERNERAEFHVNLAQAMKKNGGW